MSPTTTTSTITTLCSFHTPHDYNGNEHHDEHDDAGDETIPPKELDYNEYIQRRKATASLDAASTTAEREAQSLQELAQKARLEAEQMSIQLTLEKIANLENQLDMLSNKNGVNGGGETDFNRLEQENMIDQIKMLKQQLGSHPGVYTANNEYETESVVAAAAAADVVSSFASSSESRNNSNNNIQEAEKMQQLESSYPQQPTATTTLPPSSSSFFNDNIPPPPPSISKEELQTRIQAYQSFPISLKERFASLVNVNDVNDAETIMIQIYELQQWNAQQRRSSSQLGQLDDNQTNHHGNDDINGATNGGENDGATIQIMTPVEWLIAEAGYYKLPQSMKLNIASSVGFNVQNGNGLNNQTQVVERLVEKNMIRIDDVGRVEFDTISSGPSSGVQETESETTRNESELQKNTFTPMSPSPSSSTPTITPKNELAEEFNMTLLNKSNISTEQLNEAVTFYESLPPPMKTMFAKSVNISPYVNSSVIIEQLILQEKMTKGENGQINIDLVLFDPEDEDEMIDPELSPESSYIKSLFPQVMRKYGFKPTQEDVDVLFTTILGKDTFNPIQKPQSIIGGYIIRGEKNDRLTSEQLMDTLNEEISKNDELEDRLKVYYIKDPNPVTEEQVDYDMVEVPVLMVTGADLSPPAFPLLKEMISISGVLSVAAYAVGCSPWDGATKSGIMDMMAVVDAAIFPLFGAMFVPQLVHEVGHQIVALKDKVSV